VNERASADSGPRPVVSIVIVHYRSPDILEHCLERIAAARIGLPHETIVVDNAPADEAATRIAERQGARAIVNERNVGYGPAVNQGMAAARGRFFLVLNPDVEVLPGSVEALAAYLEAHPPVGVCGPKLLNPDGSLQYSARTYYTFWTILLRRTFIGRLFPRAHALREHLMMDWDHGEERDVDWMMGGALLVRRAAVDDVGGMDERFFLYFEDVDWCSRMHRRGWRVVYVPQAEMIHAHQRASARGFLSRGQRIHIESALRFYEKWSAVLYLWKRKSTQLRALATFGSDLVWLSVAFLGAYLTRYLLGFVIPVWSAQKPVLALGVYARFVVFADLVAVGTFHFLGLYRGDVWRNRWREFTQLAKGIMITSLVVMASTFLFTTRPLSRFTILLFFPYGLLLVGLAREQLRRIVAEARERRLHLRRLAVFASRAQIETLAYRFSLHGTFGFEPIYVAHDDEGQDPSGGVRDPVQRRAELIENERIAQAVVFETIADRELVDRLVPRLLAAGVPVSYVPRSEALLLEAHRLADFMGFGAVSLGGAPVAVRSWLKRGLDFLIASLLLLLGLPLHAVQVLSLGRSPWRRTALIGRRGRVFELRAYRERRGLVRVMPLLRFYPALLNIVTGELSFVGIAPLRAEEWERVGVGYRLNPPDAPVGLAAEPAGAARYLDPDPASGVVQGGSGAAVARDLEEVVARNRRYLLTWSLGGDLRIFLSTPPDRRKTEGGAL
jgi:N-acetylglucosaminyl-diphospho-decaprenol L-rhamnosyltransferase